MQLSDEVAGQSDLDPDLRTIVVVFNATKSEQKVKGDAWKNAGYALAPLQAASSDARVRAARYDAGAGQFVVPARTTAVFVRK
jgi:pullulanase